MLLKNKKLDDNEEKYLTRVNRKGGENSKYNNHAPAKWQFKPCKKI